MDTWMTVYAIALWKAESIADPEQNYYAVPIGSGRSWTVEIQPRTKWKPNPGTFKFVCVYPEGILVDRHEGAMKGKDGVRVRIRAGTFIDNVWIPDWAMKDVPV